MSGSDAGSGSLSDSSGLRAAVGFGAGPGVPLAVPVFS